MITDRISWEQNKEKYSQASKNEGKENWGLKSFRCIKSNGQKVFLKDNDNKEKQR